MTPKSHFNPAFFKFLRELKKNNNRPWFQANKERYEKTVRNPLLDFIGELGPYMRRISKNLVVDNSPTGGSMFRIYRDTRFSKDKTPYKTHVSAHFPIAHPKDIHAPGYYIHLSPGEVFSGGGIWHPEAPVLSQIRDYLVNHAREWKALLANKTFKRHCSLEGEKLKRPPKGFPPDHEMIEYLKYKDFTFFTQFDEKQACSPNFTGKYLESCAAAAPMMEFLASALKLPW
jgi:uncharacterized protein (TIGR02453 family)